MAAGSSPPKPGGGGGNRDRATPARAGDWTSRLARWTAFSAARRAQSARAGRRRWKGGCSRRRLGRAEQKEMKYVRTSRGHVVPSVMETVAPNPTSSLFLRSTALGWASVRALGNCSGKNAKSRGGSISRSIIIPQPATVQDFCRPRRRGLLPDSLGTQSFFDCVFGRVNSDRTNPATA